MKSEGGQKVDAMISMWALGREGLITVRVGVGVR